MTTTADENYELVECLEPLVGENPRILILGSVPGGESLETNEYYKRNNNQFWEIMAEICNHPRLKEETYEIKTAVLMQNKIALWDTVKSCYRKKGSSKDSDIKKNSKTPNDIKDFLKKHPSIEKIIINGNGKERRKIIEEYFEKNKDLKIKPIYVYQSSGANRRDPATKEGIDDTKKIQNWKESIGQ